MKRSDVLKLIANQLDFLNGKFEGMRDTFTEKELKTADVILTTVEEAGMLPPHDGPIGIGDFEQECTSDHTSDCQWEPEDTHSYTNKDFAGW